MQKISKYTYLIVCFVFFIFCNLYLSNEMVYQLTHGYKFSNSFITFNYIKNTGAAFSILQNSRELLIILSVAALVLMLLYVIKHIKALSMKSLFFIALLSAGIAGNLHERIEYGYVRDFFQLNFVNFPVFNISDIFINIGVIALIIMILIKKTK
ncbi:MAG: signal peptidase II [Candidatus Gastranaerophilaceae bacterium]